VKIGAHRTEGCEIIRRTNKDLSDQWKVTTPVRNSISGHFRPEELTVAPRRLRSGNSPGLDSIFSKFILHDGPTLKSWSCDFLTSSMSQHKIPKIWRKALKVAIPKLEEPLGDPELQPNIFLVCPL